MACCYTDDCGEYTVSPVLVAPCYPKKYCEEPPMCCPYLPRCPKGLVYCCEKKPPKTPRPTPVYCEHDLCCDNQPPCHHTPVRCRLPRSPPPPPTRKPSTHCPTCCQPICKPVKTKYVMPCYRYEDGRIERYVPTLHGRLPMSAYRRNGIQDHMYGYRGAQQYLCTGEGSIGSCVCLAIEPMRRLYPKVTQEMLPVKRKKDKKTLS